MEIDDVISDSPYRVMPGIFWMYKSQSGDGPRSAWAQSYDGVEHTVIVQSEEKPTDLPSESYGPLRAIQLRVSLPFAAPGFLAAACSAIADTNSSILAISTFSFDYLFVKASDINVAADALRGRGFPLDPT